MSWYVGQTLEDMTRDAILSAYRHCEKNKERTAIILGISVKTVYNKLIDYGVIKKNEKGEDIDGATNVWGETSEADSSTTGISLESALEVRQEFSMPVRVQAKIQEMPPKSNEPRGPLKTSRAHKAGKVQI